MAARRDMDDGLWFLNLLNARAQAEARDVFADTVALAEILESTGAHLRAAEDAERPELERGARVHFTNVPDKYTLTDLPDIDCLALLPVCRGRCCTLRFPLSPQDLAEGVVRWDLAMPYLTAEADGRCTHQCGEAGRCGVHEQRPASCRTYDCRADPRIWRDFANRELAE